MSFGWLASFRNGQWISFRSFVLNERRDVGKRLAVIGAELRRIGEVTVLFERETDPDGNITTTERREGIFVTSGSSLERLFQVYISMGGNPLDVSMFLQPDRTRLITNDQGVETTTSDGPHQGVIAPQSTEFYTGTIYEGGYLPILKYPPRRLGRRINVNDGTTYISSRIRKMRDWISQEIKYKRNRVEENIIKLVDLREQLIKERDELIPQAVGGTVYSVPTRHTGRFSKGFSVSEISAAIDALFFEEDPLTPNKFDFNTINRVALNNQPTLFEDDENGQEEWTTL